MNYMPLTLIPPIFCHCDRMTRRDLTNARIHSEDNYVERLLTRVDGMLRVGGFDSHYVIARHTTPSEEKMTGTDGLVVFRLRDDLFRVGMFEAKRLRRQFDYKEKRLLSDVEVKGLKGVLAEGEESAGGGSQSSFEHDGRTFTVDEHKTVHEVLSHFTGQVDRQRDWIESCYIWEFFIDTIPSDVKRFDPHGSTCVWHGIADLYLRLAKADTGRKFSKPWDTNDVQLAVYLQYILTFRKDRGPGMHLGDTIETLLFEEPRCGCSKRPIFGFQREHSIDSSKLTLQSSSGAELQVPLSFSGDSDLADFGMGIEHYLYVDIRNATECERKGPYIVDPCGRDCPTQNLDRQLANRAAQLEAIEDRRRPIDKVDGSEGPDKEPDVNGIW